MHKKEEGRLTMYIEMEVLSHPPCWKQPAIVHTLCLMWLIMSKTVEIYKCIVRSVPKLTIDMTLRGC